ncbi:MAG: hypothetical protein ABWZ90_07075 [Acidimicrobiales bacterium]
MTMRRFGGKVALVATAVVLAAACTSGDDSASDSTDAGTTPGSSAPVATGPAPGVTDDTIKIGITYTDAAALDVTLPTDPTERHYGPPPDADGDPPAYLFEWNPDAEDFALIEQ